MAKQRLAGANNRDLPWWFEIYHTAWILLFVTVWYFFGFLGFFIFLLLVGGLFMVFA